MRVPAMATLQPVVVAYCPVCGIPPEFCEYNAACSASLAAVTPATVRVSAARERTEAEAEEDDEAAAAMADSLRRPPTCMSYTHVRMAARWIDKK